MALYMGLSTRAEGKLRKCSVQRQHTAATTGGTSASRDKGARAEPEPGRWRGTCWKERLGGERTSGGYCFAESKMFWEEDLNVAEGDFREPITAAVWDWTLWLLLTGGTGVGHRSSAGLSHQWRGSLHLSISTVDFWGSTVLTKTARGYRKRIGWGISVHVEQGVRPW